MNPLTDSLRYPARLTQKLRRDAAPGRRPAPDAGYGTTRTRALARIPAGLALVTPRE